MKTIHFILFALLLLLSACQQTTLPVPVVDEKINHNGEENNER
jgi:hypothetical protein